VNGRPGALALAQPGGSSLGRRARCGPSKAFRQRGFHEPTTWPAGRARRSSAAQANGHGASLARLGEERDEPGWLKSARRLGRGARGELEPRKGRTARASFLARLTSTRGCQLYGRGRRGEPRRSSGPGVPRGSRRSRRSEVRVRRVDRRSSGQGRDTPDSDPPGRLPATSGRA